MGSVWNSGGHGRDFSEPHPAGLSPGSLSFNPFSSHSLLTAHSTAQCSQVRRRCSGTLQLRGSHRCGRTWGRQTDVRPQDPPSQLASHFPAVRPWIRAKYAHVLWVGQWAGTGLAILRRSSRGVSVVTSCTQLTELTGCVVLTSLQGTRMSDTSK